MKPWHLHILLLLALAKLHAATLSPTEDVLSEISDLTDLCPYTSFCNQNASSQFPYSDDYTPCCRPCSCKPDCGFRGDCCYSHLDKFYTESAQTVVCRSGFVVEPPLNNLIEAALYRYRMINACRQNDSVSTMNETSCEHISSDAVESFNPVVSRDTGFIYVNKYCALCNNVSDIVPWQRAVTCSQEAGVLLSDSLESYMSGNHLVDSGCHVYYIPPEGFNIPTADSCNPSVMRTCNSYIVSPKNPYRKLCEEFNATFTGRLRNRVHLYANVYCFLCNSGVENANTSEIRNKQCFKSDDLNSYKLFSEFRLTVLLDVPSLDQNPVTKVDAEKGDCPVNSVSVTSFTKECRRYRCPYGQILLNNRCGYYSKMWKGDDFSVMLRLSPVKRNARIPSSFFEDMSGNHKNDRQARWISRRTLKRWNFLVLYHPYQDKPAVEYIVVKATYPSRSVNPHQLQRMVKEAVDDTWKIHYMNSDFELSVDFNKYFHYDTVIGESVREMGINMSAPFGCYPLFAFCYGALQLDKNSYQDIIFPVTYFTQDEIKTGIPITKLFFCDQVDLLPEEYDYACATVFFRVKNISIHTFMVVKSPDDGISTTSGSTESIKPSVRICLHEFEHTYNIGLRTPIHLIQLLTSLYISIRGKVLVD